MGSLLPQSPHATSLLALAARRATGRVALGDRTLVLASGDVVDIAPSGADESLEQVLVQSGRISADVLAHYEQTARSERVAIAELLVKHGALSDMELRHARRAALVDRLTRALRSLDQNTETGAAFDAVAPPLLRAPGLPLASLLLDALSRAADAADAAVVGANLNYRVDWTGGPHEDAAREWADLGDGPQRPAVSTVLAKRPAAAPRIAALLRAGLARLVPPGRTNSASSPPMPGGVPAPAPRIALPLLRLEPTTKPLDPLANMDATRAPRLRLDPGQAQANADPLEPTPLPRLPQPSIDLTDPLLALEQRVAELEAKHAPGLERARVFATMADTWRDRFGSLERACRAFREAAAADPSDASVLQQAAQHCHMLGQSELAARYAIAAVAAASLPIDRASAQRLRARIARSAGDLDTCIEALCEAAADDPACADPHEQVAALLLERGNVEGANAHARLAATALQDDEPERALALLAWAFGLLPGDVPTAYEYASLLDASGRRLGTVAVLAETAQRNQSADQKRKLRLSAAERAEASGRLDIAAELMVDAFDSEPHFDLVYGPMDEDLAAVASPEYRAVALEDVATVCPDEQRAYWLRRAGQAMLQAHDQTEAAAWLLFEALLTDGTEREALAALREQGKAGSRRELTLFAHGLRAAIVANLERDPELAERLLLELAELAEDHLDNAHMAYAAWQQVALTRDDERTRAGIARSRARLDARDAEIDLAEQAVAAAEGAARAAPCAKLAALIPDLPERWPREMQLLREVLARGAADAAARERLETLIALSRDAIALAMFLEDHADQSGNRQERVRLLGRLAAVHTVREDTPAVAAVCEALLAIDSSSRVAIARLERAARRLGDQRRIARALTLRAAITREPRARGRVLSQLARAEELAGLHNEATRHAVEALREDPSAADSGLILLRNVHRIDPRAALAGLSALRDACGASRALLATQTQSAHASGQRELQRAAVELWVRLLPSDSAAHRARLLLHADENDAQALLAAAHAALTAIPSSEVLDAAHTALDRLEALGAFEAAAELALRLADEKGRSDPALSRRAAVLARRGRSPEIVTRALELVVAVAAEGERVRALFDLAMHHRTRRDFTAEVRVLYRVLEIEPRSSDALDRLHELLLQAGDAARLLAIDGFILESETDRDRRRPLLLMMCAVAAQHEKNLDRAERYVRELVAERSDDPRHVRHALGVLLSIGDARWALARGRAIAEQCPPALGSHVYLWCALTAELRLQDAPLALEIARAGALRFPSYPESLIVVERLTLAADDADSAIATYDALIAAASGPHGRRALIYRAGRWLERAGRLAQALDRYLQAFDAAPTTGAAFKALERVARETDRVALVVPCYERLAEHLAEPRARLLMLVKASELCRNTLRDDKRAFELLLRANALSERSELDDRLLDYARDLLTRDAEAAEHALAGYAAQLDERAAQLWAAEDKGRCLLRLALVSTLRGEAPERALALADEALALARSEDLNALTGEATAARAECAARVAAASALEPLRAVPQAALEAPRAPEAKPPVSPAPPIITLKPALDPRPELRRLLDAEPWRCDVLRELHARASDTAERQVLSQLLAVIDGGSAKTPDREFQAGVWRGGSLRAAIGDGLQADLAQGLAMLWDSTRVITRFRTSLHAHGVNERDRITRISFGPVADVYARALRLLELPEVFVYVTLGNGILPHALPTHPPIVVAGRGVAQAHNALLYGMTHALWLARPEHVIGGVLAPKDARELLEAARIAFSPAANARSAAAAASTKELAAALWQNVPARSQAPLALLLRAHEATLAPDTLRARIRASAARAALLASGAFGTALRTLPLTEPELEGAAITSEQAFTRACQRSAALAETVRCALSDAFLDALRRAP